MLAKFACSTPKKESLQRRYRSMPKRVRNRMERIQRKRVRDAKRLLLKLTRKNSRR